MDKKLRILMLEANSADATAVAKELRKAGISFESRRVETKQHYEEGLQEYEPNLILADYWLPSFDGVSALTIAQEMLPEAPFIFVSGALGEELAIDAMKHGATDYVLKVGLSRLVPAVRRAPGARGRPSIRSPWRRVSWRQWQAPRRAHPTRR